MCHFFINIIFYHATYCFTMIMKEGVFKHTYLFYQAHYCFTITSKDLPGHHPARRGRNAAMWPGADELESELANS